MHLISSEPLEDKLPRKPAVKQFGDEVYIGELNFVLLNLRREVGPTGTGKCTEIMVLCLLGDLMGVLQKAMAITSNQMAHITREI